MERIRQIQPRLAAVALVAIMTAAACVSADQTAATFDDGDATLPSVTEPSSTTAASNGDNGDSEAGEAVTSSSRPTTSTTQPPAPLQGLAADLVVSGFKQPVLVTGAPGTSALFVVEREGVIRLVENGVTADEPFLDLRSQILSSSIEQGLLGLAFHPDYGANGRFFAYWTDLDGDSMLAEFRAENPTTADPDSMTTVLTVDQPAERHNAGMTAFGPDGMLYLALGDGGSGGATAQDTSNLLGSILRLDVDTTDGEPYAVPDGNPYNDEIWVNGLRNPWRFSIDPISELVYIGDVGQDGFEEINVVGLDGAGTNFGWFETEGDRCFRSGCDLGRFTPPVLQYTHDEGCSVTGGHVYRGKAIPEFNGHYFFADWCTGFVRSMRLAGERVVDQRDWTADFGMGQVTSFGLDNEGELHAVNWDGELYRIVPVR